MKIKIFLISSIFCFALVLSSGCGGPIDYQPSPMPPDPNYRPIITNATDSDPIIGHWVFQNENTYPPVDIAFERDGYAEKLENVNNFTFTQIRGPWTKISENSYFIQWVVELEMSGDYHVNGSFIPTNETITYDPSGDRINVSGNFYIRKNVMMTDNSSNFTK